MTPKLPGICLCLLAVASAALAAQQKTGNNLLPVPSGPSGVGRITYHWVDSIRPAFLDSTVAARRELMVDVWYPVARHLPGVTADYLPNLPTLRRAMSDSVLRRRFAPAFEQMEASRLQTHAKENGAVVCGKAGCPLLVFSHGSGVDRSFYTAQIEDLASHGYIVAAIAHTYETGLVVFPDGRIVRAMPAPRDTVSLDGSQPRWRQELAAELRREAHLRRVIDVEAADIRFVIGTLAGMTTHVGARTPFTRMIDLTRIGALGHSMGGRAAARACQLDLRVKACLNQDGVIHALPFVRTETGETMRQPFLYVGRQTDYTFPQVSDAALAAMQMTRAEMDSVVRAVAMAQTKLLAAMPAGAYRTVLKDSAATHMSFSDEPLIQGADDSLRHEAARRVLGDIQRLTRAFFDETLRGRRSPILAGVVDGGSPGRIRVDRFPPKRTPPRH